jgi:hypothetical protein
MMCMVYVVDPTLASAGIDLNLGRRILSASNL